MKNCFIALMIASVSASAAASDDQFSLSGGAEYSTGKYGNATATDILYLPVTGRYETGKLFLRLTVPYISITGPGGVVRGLGRIGPANNRATTTTHSGLGDIIASAGYNVYASGALSLDAVGNIKFGTANANQGLGTGQNDYSAQIDGYYTVRKTTFFATAGYKVYGSPAGTNLNSAPYGTLGASHKLNDVTSVGLMLDVVQSPSASVANQEEITGYISQLIAHNLKIQANVMRGFANGSPDYGGGFMATGYF